MISRNSRKSLNIPLRSVSPRVPRTSRNVARPLPNPYQPGMKWRFLVRAKNHGKAPGAAGGPAAGGRGGRGAGFRGGGFSAGGAVRDEAPELGRVATPRESP